MVAGAVVTIPTGVEYAAALGRGATRDGVAISVRPSPPLAERLVLTGFGYQREVREHQAGCVARAAARGPRHPTDGLLRPRPVPRRGRER